VPAGRVMVAVIPLAGLAMLSDGVGAAGGLGDAVAVRRLHHRMVRLCRLPRPMLALWLLPPRRAS
jgi:hypothetical protein